MGHIYVLSLSLGARCQIPCTRVTGCCESPDVGADVGTEPVSSGRSSSSASAAPVKSFHLNCV